MGRVLAAMMFGVTFVLGPTSGAVAGDEPGATPGANGLALTLEVGGDTFPEDADLTLGLVVKNVSDRELRLPAWGLGPRCGLVLAGPDGEQVSPSFARDHSRQVTESDIVAVAPGAAHRFELGANWDGKGRLVVGEPQGGIYTFEVTKGPVVLRARMEFRADGRFGKELAARFGSLWTGRVLSPPIEVAPAGLPAVRGLSANGLALAVSAERHEFTMKPLKLRRALRDSPHFEVQQTPLTLTFENLSDHPIRLDAYDLAWRRLKLEIEGPRDHSVVVKSPAVERLLAAPTAGDFPVIAPRGTFQATVSFPDRIGGGRTILNAVGAYRVRVVYRPEGSTPPPEGKPNLFRGGLTSNEIVLTGFVPEAPPEDHPK